MFKLIILISIFNTFLNASFASIGFKQTPIKPVPSKEYCYKRILSGYSFAEYVGNTSVQYYCRFYSEKESSSYINADVCSGPTQYSLYDPIPEASSVELTRKAWSFSLKLCSEIDMTKDEDGVEVFYKDGIPYDKSDIENALYFDSYTNILVCNSSYLQINNDSCIQPNYEERNLADAILKRDKIARENNLTNVGGINPDNITYNDDGSIKSFSFTALNSEGGIESIYTEFREDDPVFTVKDDGTITESEYVSNSENGTTTPVTGETGTNNSGTTGGTGTNNSENNAGVSSSVANDISSIQGNTQSSNNHLYDIKENIIDIAHSLNPDLRNTTLENPLEESDTYYDDYVIPQVQELITNFTSDFNSLKNTYIEKINYIQENGFEFNYESKLYETCPMDFKFNPFQSFEDKNFKDNELSLNIDVCSLMANAKLPNSEISALVIFHTIFYIFFYTVILLGIFKLMTLTFRSF
ncbi:hypothetical protein [Aliarcobacter butzleri]|uniref:hypothetical protein n=1 Tax=Aliarcobacter butzleri TaxID=28197 RepID=UPI00344BBED3